MEQVLLVGNGVTSQLIQNYKDEKMMSELDKMNSGLIHVLNEKFNIFRNVYKNDDNNKERIIDLIGSIPLLHNMTASQVYQKYFVDYGLKYELYNKSLSGIETLLKIATLFEMPIKNELIQIANSICFNDGFNGINDIDVDIHRDIFSKFINSFSLVFTTNYDYLLDDVYEKEVFHLHGGFNYIKIHDDCGAIDITRDRSIRKVENPFLAWGIDGNEKLNVTKGGICFPISFPMHFGSSVIDEYFNELSTHEYEEIHIWGYSGQNDKHINDSIKNNHHIKNVYYYCNPEKELNNDLYKQHISKLFMSPEKNITLRSWDDMWIRVGL